MSNQLMWAGLKSAESSDDVDGFKSCARLCDQRGLALCLTCGNSAARSHINKAKMSKVNHFFFPPSSNHTHKRQDLLDRAYHSVNITKQWETVAPQ